jgi:hypothetical protein
LQIKDLSEFADGVLLLNLLEEGKDLRCSIYWLTHRSIWEEDSQVYQKPPLLAAQD